MVIKFDPGLYIVAGPIGNLSDLTPRAAELLRNADIIAVEDSRVSAKLLRHAGSERPMVAYHDHSSEKLRTQLVERLASDDRKSVVVGKSVSVRVGLGGCRFLKT